MDPSWCPGCDRLILPKRYIVPVAPTPPPVPTSPAQADPPASDDPEHDPNHPPPPPAPTPVPSSPEVRKKPLADHTRQATRNAATRARPHGLGGGLVHGTGRVRPGGGLKPRPAATEPQKPTISPPRKTQRDATDVLAGNPTATQTSTADPYFLPAIPASTSSSGRKTRVVISQEPTPLYCSDECRARDLKNSFLDSESLSFGGAPAAVHQIAQLERVEKTVEHVMKSRRASASSDKSAPQSDVFPLPILSPIQRLADVASLPLPPVPPNTFVEPPHKLCRTISTCSASSTSTASSSRLPNSDSKNSTIRASSSQPRSRPALPIRTGSFSAWSSPTKAALAPPTQTFFTAGSSSSLDSCASSLSAGSALFDEDDSKLDGHHDGEDTCATTPSRRGSGSSGASKKEKRVSFASGSKPPSPTKASADRRRQRNPLLDANPLRDAVSVSPKDRVQAASLPADLLPPAGALRPSQSSPSLVVDTPSPSRYGVAMWPEDEKRTTESARVHGALLRGYAQRFGPREGRSLVWGRLWAGRAEAGEKDPALSASAHEAQPDSRRKYWRAFEEREAEARARRKAAAAVQREEEERVIGELLGGTGMREEDQPQARRMKPMAYDGMPGPAELRGLTYKFDRFLYPLMQPKPTIVEKTIRRWDEARHEWIEETTREEVFQERKKLFNFVEDY